MSKKLLFIPLLVYGFYSSAQSTGLRERDSTSSHQLDQVVITATKYPVKTSQTGKVVTVITREQLDRSTGKDLSQLLNEQTGIFVSGSYSNPGKDKSPFIRGAKAEYTLITIDGIPVYDATATNSNFDLRLLPVDHIERIEILKGSQSTLYGSDAIAGVINIITRKGGTKTVSPSIVASYGSYNTLKLNAGINGSKDLFSYNVSFAHLKTDGISESTDKNNSGTFDKDGYRQNSLNANLGFKISENLRLNPFVRYSHFNGRLDADAFADDKDYTYQTKNLQAGMINHLQIGNARLNLLYNYTHTRREYANDSLIKESPFDGYSTGYYEGEEHLLDAYVNVPLTHSLSFTGGIDYRRSQTDVNTFGIYKYDFGGAIYSDAYESRINADSANQNQTGIYGALTWTGKKGFTLEAGSRFNYHSVYGNNAVFNINPSYLINRRWKIFTNISSAYKVPTLYQLYSEYRNPAASLDPEKAIAYEGGLQYYSTNNTVLARIAVFKRVVKDGIAFYTDPITYASYYINQDEQNDWGFEIEPTVNIGKKIQAVLSYAFVDGEITTKSNAKDTSYFNLIRRPKNILSAALNYQATPALFANVSIKYFGQRTDLDFSAYPPGTVELPPYALVNFYIEYSFFKKLKIFADLKNLLNTSYTEALGYNSLGRNINTGISVHL